MRQPTSESLVTWADEAFGQLAALPRQKRAAAEWARIVYLAVALIHHGSGASVPRGLGRMNAHPGCGPAELTFPQVPVRGKKPALHLVAPADGPASAVAILGREKARWVLLLFR